MAEVRTYHPTWSEPSDVYVALADGSLWCQECIASRGGDRRFADTNELVAHLDEHSARGHVVPSSILGRLRRDQEDNDELCRRR